MDLSFDFNKEYGVVLEGGGAKGAYQIGVWKAFLEHGVKIKGVSGVSVGALNGALICMGDYENAEALWSNITYSDIMNGNNEQLELLIKRDIKNLNFKLLTKDTTKLISDGGIDITPLKELINKYVDEEKIKESPIEFVFGTFLVSKLKEIEVTAGEEADISLKDYLLASSLLPAFKNEKLGGKKFLDGGMFNNVPIDMLMNKGYKDIIVVRIYGMGLEKHIKIPKDVNLIEIAPRVNLGGILEFDSNKSKRNIMIGYLDALRWIKKLTGKIYYLESTPSEHESLSRLMNVNDAIKMALLEYFKFDYLTEHMITRRFIEGVCPNLAGTLKLQKDWTYKELYVALLELCAKTLKIPKYKIYNIEDMVKLIKVRYEKMQERRYQFPIFHELIIKMVII